MVSASGKLVLRRRRDREQRKRLPGNLLGVAGIFLSMTAARADDVPVYSRFGFCSAPVPPACVDTMDKAGPSADCRADAEAYVASVFKYRECLSAEMQRAVREANRVIDRVRCATDPSLCAGADADSQK